MDLNPKDAVLGYKFEVNPKKSIVQLPSNKPTSFNTILEKVKSHMGHACTRAVILEIHNLVIFMLFVTRQLLIFQQAAKWSMVALKKKQIVEVTKSSLTVKQTHKLARLKLRLRCAEGHRLWCWVASDGTHRTITVFQITLWAQMIVHDLLILTWPLLTYPPRPMGLPRVNDPPK